MGGFCINQKEGQHVQCQVIATVAIARGGMLQLGMSLSGWMVGMLVMSGKGMVATVGHVGLVVGGPGLGPARSVQGPESTLASTSNAHRRKKERKGTSV